MMDYHQGAFKDRLNLGGRIRTSRRSSTIKTRTTSSQGSIGSTSSTVSSASFTGKPVADITKLPVINQRQRNLSFGASITKFKSTAHAQSPDRQNSTIFLPSPGRERSTSLLRHQPFHDYQDLPNSADLGHPAASARSRASFISAGPYSNMLALGASRMPIPIPPPPVLNSPTLDLLTFQHIQEMTTKRICTLDYLRKVHQGKVYWFNTLLFNKPDLAGMPYFDSRKLARRATNYLLLGISLPTILDLNSSSAPEFLRNLNALLSEFETFQQIHPSDGSSASSLSRARIPHMFKRSTSSKTRRASSAADIGLPMGNDSGDLKSVTGSISSSAAASATSFASSENDLLPGEEYSHLLTPSLPFDPDFYETFATLCDVLIDCYRKVLALASAPKDCTSTVAELFSKADGKIRKIIVQSVVKEFEETSRSGVRSEVAGVGKVVLGGLM